MVEGLYEFAKAVREARVRLGLDVTHLAESVRVSTRCMLGVECGDRIPSGQLTQRICKRLHIGDVAKCQAINHVTSGRNHLSVSFKTSKLNTEQLTELFNTINKLKEHYA